MAVIFPVTLIALRLDWDEVGVGVLHDVREEILKRHSSQLRKPGLKHHAVLSLLLWCHSSSMPLFDVVEFKYHSNGRATICLCVPWLISLEQMFKGMLRTWDA